MGKTAIIIGATGLIGGHLLRELLNDETYSQVKVFGRRSVGLNHPNLLEYLIDFEELQQHQTEIKGDVLFSCLGTTIKQAGSKAAQFKVDYTYQYEFARIAAENRVKAYFLVSSAGANSKSKYFYPRIKGELENNVSQLDFTSIHIFQPSLLIGQREKSRGMEKFSARVLPLLIRLVPKMKKYKAIEGLTVARAMLNVSKVPMESKREFITLDAIFDYA